MSEPKTVSASKGWQTVVASAGWEFEMTDYLGSGVKHTSEYRVVRMECWGPFLRYEFTGREDGCLVRWNDTRVELVEIAKPEPPKPKPAKWEIGADDVARIVAGAVAGDKIKFCADGDFFLVRHMHCRCCTNGHRDWYVITFGHARRVAP